MSNLNKQELIIERVFNISKQLVYEAFTQSNHLAQWWGPVGFTIEVISSEIKVNGKFHYSMKSADGYEMFGIFHYKELEPFDKIVFTNSFADEHGNIIPAPIEGPFPSKILNTWTFIEKDNQTILTLKGTPFTDNLNEIEGFTGLHEDMNQGYNKTIDQLESYINAQFKIRTELKPNNKVRVSSYLNFPGNTEEAFNFYKSVFGGEFSGNGIQRFGDIPAQEGAPSLPDSDKNLILHIELEIMGGFVLMATDAPESMGFKVYAGNNMHINLEPESREETKRIFEALSEGGTISMPLDDTFWGAYYGSFRDKYGINWMLNYAEIK
ncbi:MAG: SRPBCC domain-containing protein [Bacteroidota bacterium]